MSLDSLISYISNTQIITELVKRNKNIPPSEVVKITTMAGCSAVK